MKRRNFLKALGFVPIAASFPVINSFGKEEEKEVEIFVDPNAPSVIYPNVRTAFKLVSPRGYGLNILESVKSIEKLKELTPEIDEVRFVKSLERLYYFDGEKWIAVVMVDWGINNEN